MKVILRSVVADEVFTSRWAMCFENGLIMQTNPSFIWASDEEKNKIREDWNVVVAEMTKAGFEVEDRRTK